MLLMGTEHLEIIQLTVYTTLETFYCVTCDKIEALKTAKYQLKCNNYDAPQFGHIFNC